jgi:hypothetical protein
MIAKIVKLLSSIQCLNGSAHKHGRSRVANHNAYSIVSRTANRRNTAPVLIAGTVQRPRSWRERLVD